MKKLNNDLMENGELVGAEYSIADTINEEESQIVNKLKQVS